MLRAILSFLGFNFDKNEPSNGYQQEDVPYYNSEYFTAQQQTQDNLRAQGYQQQGMSLPEARQQAAKERYDDQSGR